MGLCVLDRERIEKEIMVKGDLDLTYEQFMLSRFTSSFLFVAMDKNKLGLHCLLNAP